MTTHSVGEPASFETAQQLFRAISPQANRAMNAPAPLISNMSVFIFSYFLVNAGVSNRLPPNSAVNCVLIGTVGFIAYFAFEWTAHLRTNAVAV